MTDQPSEAALQKACEVLSYDSNYRTWNTTATSSYERGVWECIYSLARHFDAEDKLAREAVGRVILSMPPQSSLLEFADALRDAGLLRE